MPATSLRRALLTAALVLGGCFEPTGEGGTTAELGAGAATGDSGGTNGSGTSGAVSAASSSATSVGAASTATSTTASSTTATSTTASSTTTGSGSTTTSSSTTSVGATGSTAPGTATLGSTGTTGSTGTSTTGTSTTTGGTSGTTLYEPSRQGPYGVTTLQGQVDVPPRRQPIDVTATFPVAGSPGAPYPVLVFGHGFGLGIDQYAAWAARVASFGYVVVLPDYQASAFNPDHAASAQQLLAGFTWAADQNGSRTSPLGGRIDLSRRAMGGHSLGGKLAVLGAASDPRVNAVLGIDPVDTAAQGCSAQACPSALAAMPLRVPFGTVGETLDSTAQFGQACAPAAANYAAFFDRAVAPAIELTIAGAGHASFVDDPNRCLICGACNRPTTDAAQVHELSDAFSVAFLQRHLRGLTAYDAFLTGTLAQQRWVATGRGTLRSR